MSYSIATLKDELNGTQHGTTLAQITGLNEVINRAGRELLSDIDPIETVRIEELSSPLFEGVNDYPSPTDLKDDGIIDIRPQIKRTFADRFFQFYNQEFDLGKAEPQGLPQFTIQWNKGLKSLRCAKSLVAPILVNSASDLISNGTWVNGGNASVPTADQLNNVYAGGSLKFDVSAGGTTAYLEDLTQQAIDLSRDLNEGSLFYWAYVQDASHLTSYNLRWGSSNANYWTATVTTAQDGNAFKNGWNLLKFNWLTATKVGTPVVTAITYVRFTLNYDGTAMPACRFNYLSSSLGSIYEIEYYSKFLFRDASTGAFQESVTSDTNIINLDTTSYNVFFNLVALFAAQQVQATDGKFDVDFYQKQYDKSRKRYVGKTRSQKIKPTQFYYRMSRRKVSIIREGI